MQLAVNSLAIIINKLELKYKLFDVSSIICIYCRYIEINITEKASLCTGLFTGETRLLFIWSTEQEPSTYVTDSLYEISTIQSSLVKD